MKALNGNGHFTQILPGEKIIKDPVFLAECKFKKRLRKLITL